GFCLAQLERPKQCIQVMAGHVAYRSSSKMTPRAPIERMQPIMVFAKWRGAYPFVPVQARWHRFAGGPPTFAAEIAAHHRLDLGLDFLYRLSHFVVIDIDESDAPLIGGNARIAAAHAATTNHRDAEFPVRCGLR